MLKLTIKDLDKVGQENTDMAIRQLRDPLLIAYDAYKTAVNYGEIIETEEEHNRVLVWAQSLRDMDISALDNVPEKVRYYL